MIEDEISQEHTKSADYQWNRILDLNIVPHPGLTQSDTIAAEYGMVNNMLKIQVRAATAGYVLRHWKIDCSKHHILSYDEYHLWLQNTAMLYGVDNLLLSPGYEPETQEKKQ